MENWSPGQSKATQNPACSKRQYLPSGCSRVRCVQYRPFRSSPNPDRERRPQPHGASRHQRQAPLFNFSLVAFLSLSVEQIERDPRAVGGRSQATESEEQEQCRQGTRPPMAASPPKRGDKVATRGTSHLSGRVARAAVLEQGQAGWQQSSLLPACDKSAPKQTFHAAINLLKE